MLQGYSNRVIVGKQGDQLTAWILLVHIMDASSSKAAAATGGQSDRLYVGNLHPSVEEITLLQVFQKYGQITKLDFMFHKTGVSKGKPRGFAFIQFAEQHVSD